MADNLPAELVRKVLLHLKADFDACRRPPSLLKTFTVCRVWREIGYELLYTDISLTKAQIAKFVESSSTGQAFTRSLSISISYMEWPYRNPDRLLDICSAASLKKVIQPIPQIVQGMVRLESFSLVASARARVRLPLCKAVESTIPEILRALPKSLKHLELDAGDADFQQCLPPLEHSCFCHLVRERIPSLSNLRLRVPRLCGELFNTSPVEHPEDTNVNPRNDAEGSTILINTIESSTRRLSYARSPLQNPIAANGLRDLAFIAQSSIANGRLRNLQRLSFFTLRRGLVTDPLFSAVNELVLAPTTRTLRYPFADATFLRFQDLDGSQKEAWGQLDDLMDLIEGRVWVETAERYRLPSVYLKQTPRFASSVVMNKLVVQSGPFGLRLRGPLSVHEKAEGRQLLRVQEIQGLRVGFVKRDLTTKELENALGAGNVVVLAAEDENGDDIWIP
ncbi:uncharacterized protein Z519_01690 [Cladophialophora bantiana CBS 173.52]|uniref:F-box domain-containing protein n=1 Tax=Cladophialophora bantiana (strain ATCC 10958 / CBS 173.52 / CDC B-1940 / NIH 8579) TaxID=1442370 RepID=A0A0D2F7P0_CLAB1|nr:uncharacterized protein Z519_01690 [Cladophialophora bantiana CBS 173.52]KIW98106.1 hypothetical protein Z519_01690 [Cladophialophora bantiana CBS 173.52]